jgi:hypothetical protein
MKVENTITKCNDCKHHIVLASVKKTALGSDLFASYCTNPSVNAFVLSMNATRTDTVDISIPENCPLDTFSPPPAPPTNQD